MDLAPNPSHLEAVDAVVEGICRVMDPAVAMSKKILPIFTIMGPAVAGQGGHSNGPTRRL